MKIVVSGASGFLGSALVPALRADGHDVVRLVRREPRAADEIRWDPSRGEIDQEALRGIDAAVHLAGAGVGDRRWTPAYKQSILDSRVLGTGTLARALGELPRPPRVLLSGSAIGYYGDTGKHAADERTPAGETFLAGVTRDWEAATAPAEHAGIRVVHARSGLVMAPKGGAFGRLLLLMRFGLGGRLGSGRQWWSWVTLEDELRAMRFLLTADDIAGPVNVTAPEPATNADITRALARALHRPSLAVAPAAVLRVVLGEFAEELLISQRAVPARLLEAGFSFKHPDVATAARTVA